ncbi:MAG: hypothetical protein DWQ05_14535 [Calditrichaeota bacterium]|nr:MAG: hypothetical protein DWQ05_14535 [Calditrichota bacterium]
MNFDYRIRTKTDAEPVEAEIFFSNELQRDAPFDKLRERYIFRAVRLFLRCKTNGNKKTQ